MTPPPYAAGITGHRPNRLAPNAAGRIAAGVDAALAALGPPDALVTALAEGADRIAARAALARGWRLIAPLPFPAEDYAADFAEPASRAEFDALLARAQVEICGPPRAALADEADGYAAASSRMVELVRVVIAVWDGDPARAKGGTFDTLLAALDRGRPVVWIDAAGAAAPAVYRPGEGALAASGARPARGLDALSRP